MRCQKAIALLVILSIFSGCIKSPDKDTTKTGELIEVASGFINKKASINNLEVDAIDYKIYGSSIGKILRINFKITNKGKNEVEPYPDRFVIILTDGSQIEEVLPTDEISKQINKAFNMDIKQGKDIFPSASANFYKLFLVPTNFDIKSTKIEVLSGNRVETLQ